MAANVIAMWRDVGMQYSLCYKLLKINIMDYRYRRTFYYDELIRQENQIDYVLKEMAHGVIDGIPLKYLSTLFNVVTHEESMDLAPYVTGNLNAVAKMNINVIKPDKESGGYMFNEYGDITIGGKEISKFEILDLLNEAYF